MQKYLAELVELGKERMASGSVKEIEMKMVQVMKEAKAEGINVNELNHQLIEILIQG